MNTSRDGSTRLNSLRQRLLKNSSRSSAPLVFFSAVRQTLERAAYGSLAHRYPAGGEEELGPLRVSRPWPLFQIFQEQLPRLLVQLRFIAGGLRRLQSTALLEPLTVAFDRGTIYPETARSLGLGDALLDRLDDLLSEVQRIRTHACALPGASSSQSAVTPPWFLELSNYSQPDLLNQR